MSRSIHSTSGESGYFRDGVQWTRSSRFFLKPKRQSFRLSCDPSMSHRIRRIIRRDDESLIFPSDVKLAPLGVSKKYSSKHFRVRLFLTFDGSDSESGWVRGKLLRPAAGDNKARTSAQVSCPLVFLLLRRRLRRGFLCRQRRLEPNRRRTAGRRPKFPIWIHGSFCWAISDSGRQLQKENYQKKWSKTIIFHKRHQIKHF